MHCIYTFLNAHTLILYILIIYIMMWFSKHIYLIYIDLLFNILFSMNLYFNIKIILFRTYIYNLLVYIFLNAHALI